jgi:DNA polymerase I-like protein with 3'-5' exonuclease and polymerase domains
MQVNLFFLGTSEDEPYLPRLKSHISSARVSYSLAPVSTWTELQMHCQKKQITQVFTSSASLLKILLHRQGEKKSPSIDNYAGSIFKRDGIEVLIVNPLSYIIKVSYGSFLLRHYLSKFISPEDWPLEPEFNFSLFNPSNAQETYTEFSNANLLAVDIETYKENLAIRCVGYTAVWFADSGITCRSYVIPCDSDFALSWIRKFNALPVGKIFQNGKYDLAYLARYNAVPVNYLWDTATFFHCWYSELPKDLAFLSGFCVRNSMYWKDLAETSDLHEYYLYNAKDTHATALSFLYMVAKSPAYAKTNYLQEFPLLFPAHLCELTGIKRDMPKLKEARESFETKISGESASLDKILAVKNFNTNSPVQVKALLKILGCADLESTDEKNLKKASLRHPLNAVIIKKILDIRGFRKLVSTYLVEGKELDGRILYSLNPHGTDTGRLASREHHFWCGLQIQNIPRGPEVKQTLVADPDFKLFEADLEQAESRDTAYISGDENLQRAVECGKDFHSTNASAFFGVPYESIYDDSKGETKDKPLRDLAKRVNHGANYNMGPNVLVDTMGEDSIWKAKSLLKLPKIWSTKQVAEHLLNQFHKTYPKIAAVFYKGVIHEITTTGLLSSKATHHAPYQSSSVGWVRRCFGDPRTNKSDLNAYVAHPPQSLNAATLNKAFLTVFYEIALENVGNFKLCAQIHDSILFQCRVGYEHLAQEVVKRMEIPVTIKGYDLITRTFTVPAALKAGKDGKGADRWSETE